MTYEVLTTYAHDLDKVHTVKNNFFHSKLLLKAHSFRLDPLQAKPSAQSTWFPHEPISLIY
jgi:hypothetical protein